MMYRYEMWEHAHPHTEHDKDGPAGWGPHEEYHRLHPALAQTHEHYVTVTEGGVTVAGHHTNVEPGHHMAYGGRPMPMGDLDWETPPQQRVASGKLAFHGNEIEEIKGGDKL